jgi:hypothetical protein
VPNGAAVDSYIAQASPGDVLQLGAQHPSFQVTKGVVIVGQPGGTTITGPLPGGQIQVAVPAGQRASLSRLSLPSGGMSGFFVDGSLFLQSGQCHVEDVTVAFVRVVDGVHILQRVTAGGVPMNISGGLCVMSQVTLIGRNASGLPTDSSRPALVQSGGTLVASRLTATGGNGLDLGFMTHAASPGVQILGGSTFLTDSSVTGGAGSFGPFGAAPGAAALVGTGGNVQVARTALTPGAVGSGTPSSGFQTVGAMVGMRIDAAPTRGATFQVTATAGDSLGLLVVVGGFHAIPNNVPPVVEPLFGIPADLVPLTWALPAAGANVACSVAVPNAAQLFGADVWLQAIQLTPTDIRASAVVGGAIR